MRIKIFAIVALIMASQSIYSITDTWGPTGHRATGKIAEKHLSRRAKKKIDELLQGESLAFISTYADEIKSDRNFRKYYSWHYVNMPLDSDYESSEKNPKGDLVTGVNYCIKVLKDEKSSIEDKRFHLKMLVHLIGDLHQPLHIGRKEDKGGNTIQVQWHGKGSNLHRVWDEDMLRKWGMSYIELADNAKDLSKNQIKAIQNGSLLDWVKESHELTKMVYASAENGEKLRYRYSYVHFPIVREQLQKGGLRLAKLLNEIFD
ncbi:S1/P1 nuclease [Tenacibaculum sp. MEBiC06402]|uniref:S1/P1 nuclease n=1 Tax=unclassified Tenacibaculum TaxID=2635139 RepID=UPI003B999C0D